MSLRKTIRVVDMPEYQEYLVAWALYSKEKREYPKFKRLGLDKSENPLERLRAFERKEKNSKVCKDFYAAKRKYETAYAKTRLKERGIELTELNELTISQALEINAPVTFEEIRKTNRSERISDEELTRREQAAEECLKYLNKKTGYTSQRYDPTLEDNDPLPDSSIAKEESYNEEK